ncbi:ubiquinone biosynthesis protein COQ9 [Aspergillus heteromorphus CBS 117.55]|uniref:Ubiquinone biosynthesis protein n=1 Tax=Aspergillus heteromorphus CBS 117.55 TaxID=1448321 RepID=A0A317V9R5_9EURO|nr:ubiquinone biosynthesis protein COQ9 [Aspergillus heteromorphus CBS 117.55]PWY69768.1 ubiquinone biosynthesis protein COQ9 [Aspergillus heteromorphus CBS 117.55]
MTRSQSLLTLSRRYLTTAARPTTTTAAAGTAPSKLASHFPTHPQPRLQHLRHHCPYTSRTTRPTIRTYHSAHHPAPLHEYSNSQTTILSASLRHVPTHGFSRDALTLGARDAGFLDVSVQLFPRGEFDLILFWLASRRGLLRSRVENDALLQAQDGGAPLSVDEKIKVLIMERLRMNEEVRDKWQDALAVMSLGENVPLSLSELHSLLDDILTLAGDVSVDASWYSKRFALAAVYTSSEFVMTRDSSANLRDTEEFLTRRLADSKAIGEKITGVRQCLGFMGSTAVGLGRSWGLKI